MQHQQQEHSLTSDFRMKASTAERRARQELERAKQARNKANQAAIGNWHNESRGKSTEIPFPVRRTT